MEYRVKISASIVVIFFFVFIIGFSRIYGPLSDLKYSVPFLLLLIPFVSNRPVRVFDSYNYIAKIIGFWLVMWFLTITIYHPLNFAVFKISTKELFLISAPIISVLIVKDYLNWDKFSKLITYIALFFVLIEVFKSNIGLNTLLSLKSFLIHSKAESETPFAMAYGSFLIFFLVKRKWGMSIISVFLILMGGKRIVIGAVLLVILAYPIIKYLSKRPKAFRFLMVGGNVGVVVILILLSLHYFDQLIYEYTGLAARAFTKGRSSVYEIILNQVDLALPFGSGLGNTSFIMRNADTQLNLAHSDILKIFVETGWLGFIIFFYWFYSIGKNNAKATLVLLYMNIIMLTDNSMIYYHVSFINYLIVFLLIKNTKVR